MRKIRMLLILLCAFGAAGAYAAENDEHAAHRAAGTQDAATGAETPPAGSSEKKMGQQMKRMQDLMEKIRSTDDPQLRNELLAEHLEAMQETMNLMQGPDKKAKSGDKQKEGPDGDDGMKMGMMKKHAKMEVRLSTLEALMKQILEREEAESDMETYH